MTRAPDPGRMPKSVWIRRFLVSDAREATRTWALRLGLKRLEEIVPADWAVPDTALAGKAAQMAEALCQPFVLRHSFRTYCFGAALAARDGLRLDREMLFIASILHDLGLSETHKDDEGSFEWVGARLAHRFCCDHGMTPQKADLIHDAIALHAQPGIADQGTPEGRMVHFGAGLDLFAMRLKDLPKPTLVDILKTFPREGFKPDFGACLHHQARAKPKSSIAGLVDLGLPNRIRAELS